VKNKTKIELIAIATTVVIICCAVYVAFSYVSVQTDKQEHIEFLLASSNITIVSGSLGSHDNSVHVNDQSVFVQLARQYNINIVFNNSNEYFFIANSVAYVFSAY
jgi:hypothetical protein